MNSESIYTGHLFRPLSRRLISLLGSLTEHQWDSGTCYPSWKVHDIAGHLLQTALGRLRDSPQSSERPRRSAEPDFEQLSERITDTNDAWARSFASLNPVLLVDLIQTAERHLAHHLRHLDPRGTAAFPVAWAGDTISPNWFDTAREFTERWHHQQQIRDAVGAPGIASPRFLRPVLATLIRAVPHWFAEIDPAETAVVRIHIQGASGGSWDLCWLSGSWELNPVDASRKPTATVSMTEDTAWRILTRTIRAEKAKPLIHFAGDSRLSYQFLKVTSVMMPESLR